MPIDNLRKGAGLALVTATVSGLAVFLNKFAVTGVSDPVVYTTLKNGLVALLLVGLVLALGKRKEIASLNRQQKVRLLLVGLIGGAIPFALFFSGLKMTASLNAAIIHKTLFVWVILLAIPFLKEKMRPGQWLGAAAVFGAVILIGGFKGFAFDLGELMILGATLFWAVENVIAKKALADVSAVTLSAARLGIGSLLLLPLALYRGGLGIVATMNPTAWGWTLLAVGLLFLYVTTWYSALKLAPAGLVATLLVPAVLVTGLLNAVFVTKTASIGLLAAAILFLLGTAAMVGFAKAPEPAGEPVS